MAITIKDNALKQRAENPISFSGKSGANLKRFLDTASLFRPRVKPEDGLLLLSQLSLTIEIGMSVKKSLSVIGKQTKNPSLKDVIKAMEVDIDEGRQLSDAMRRHPRLFSAVQVAMIKAGEKGGFLKGIVDRIVEMQEKRQALITKVRSALTYPLVLCVLAVSVIVFILVGVLPKFTRFFQGKEEILPWTTQLLIFMSDSIRGYWWIYGASVCAMIAWFRWWTNSARGKASIDWFLVRGPAFSKIYNKISTSNMLRTLGHLMESQVPLLEALQVTHATTKSPHYAQLVTSIASHVENGGKFAEVFKDSDYISETVKAMVATGENASKLPPVMLRLSEAFDSEVDREIKTLSSMIEPMALLIMGGVVALLVSSIILPMFKMAQALH